MNRLTLASCRPTIARVLGTCPTDARVAMFLNDAQERLMGNGRWVGTIVRYRFCVSSSCITLPRQIDTVEAWALCDSPMPVRDKWYEFVGNGPGQQRESKGSTQLVDRGTSCCYLDISGTSSYINVVAQVPEAAGAVMLIQGWDENNNWVRTEYPASSGIYIDGENVPITNLGARTTKKFTSWTGTVKPITNGPVDAFEWPAALGGNLQQLAHYESDETTPIYRRYLIPSISEMSACCTSTNSCDSKTVTILAKLGHIAVINDNDFLILQNLAALKLMVMAILKEERNLWQEAIAYETKAIKELENDLEVYEGAGPTPVLRLASSDVFGGDVGNEIDGFVFGNVGTGCGC